jgi:hypothetical protein
MRRLVITALAALMLMVSGLATPKAAAADDWFLSLYPQYGGRIGGAPGGPLGIDSRIGIETSLAVALTNADGWGANLGFSWAFDMTGNESPGLFHFTFEPTLMKRMVFLETEVLSIDIGPSLGLSNAAYDSRCPTNCTPEEDAVGAVYDAHDSFVFGGVATVAIDHMFGGETEGLFAGIALRGRGLWAVADETSPARWSGAILLRFGGHFAL